MPKIPKSHPTEIKWEFDPDIPTEDFFCGIELDETLGLQEAVENFIRRLKDKRFLTWEAVVAEEQGLPLTSEQKDLVGDLLSFADEDEEDEEKEEGVLYINGTARPTEPWHVILNKILPRLLIEPFRTFDIHKEVQCDGWKSIAEAMEEHGKGLSLPKGTQSWEDVVPTELRHKLILQDCFDALGGLGQEDDMHLKAEDESWRIDDFIDDLRKHKESVAFFDLTLDSLLTKVILPDQDLPIFKKAMMEKLGLKSPQDRFPGNKPW